MASQWDQQLDEIGRMAGIPLRGSRSRTVAALDRSPVNVEAPDGPFRVGGIGILTILRADLPDGRAIANVPTFVRAIGAGNHAILSTRIQQLHGSLSKSFNLMTLAVDCSSGWTRERRDRARAEESVAVMRNVNVQWDDAICQAVTGGAGVPAAIEEIDAPALFVTGTFDVNAPTGQTEEIRKHFKRGVRLLVRNGAHETLPASVVQDQVVRFLNGETPATDEMALPSPLGEAPTLPAN